MNIVEEININVIFLYINDMKNPIYKPINHSNHICFIKEISN